jgi:hypothetical protein
MPRMRIKAETKGNEGSEGFPQSGRIGIYLCFFRYLLLKKVPADRPAVVPYLSLLSGKSVAKFTSVVGEEVARISRLLVLAKFLKSRIDT